MPLSDFIELIVTSFMTSASDADLDATLERYVHPAFRLDANGLITDRDGWKARWRALNSVTKDRKLDVRFKIGSDEGPVDASKLPAQQGRKVRVLPSKSCT